MVRGCQEVLDDAIGILVAHNAEEGDKYWKSNGSGNRIISSGVLSWQPPSNRQCGWSNHFCTAICMKCARRLGYVW